MTLKEEGAYFKKLQKSLSIPISSTHEAIKQSLLAIPNVNHANIISSAGKIAIHLIIDPNYIQDGIIHNEIKMNIGNAIYHTVASGTAFEGNINLEFLNHAEQKKKYKFSLGVIKHAYLKVLYQTETETIYKEIDNQIREIYKKIIQNKYQDMGIAFRHQDFLSPVSLIRELKSIRVGIYVKEKLDNTKITNIKEHEFKFNTDLEINENEIIFFDENLRLIIDRE